MAAVGNIKGDTMHYKYYVIRLTQKTSDAIPSTTYLGAKRGQTVYSIGEARCYRTFQGANKTAKKLKCVPLWSPEIMGRVTHQSEFGGNTWFTAEILNNPNL